MRHVIYAFPGLGADRRMFGFQLALDFEIRFLNWIPPVKGETMNQYAGRLSNLIDTSRPFSLLGVSLGGMMCMEIAKFVPAEKVILISSCKTRSELPPQLRAMKQLKLNKVVPASTLKVMIQTFSGFIGDLKGDVRSLFIHMVDNCDPVFLTWAANAVVNWDNETIPENVVHIHGDADNVLQYRYVKPDYTLKKGTHYMVGTRSDEVNALLVEALKDVRRVPLLS